MDKLGIGKINSTAMDGLRFKDFLQLKSGRDQFSTYKETELMEALGNAEYQSLLAEFGGSITEANKAARWILRGLNKDKAVRKIKTDLEVTANSKAVEYIEYIGMDDNDDYVPMKRKVHKRAYLEECDTVQSYDELLIWGEK